MDKNLTVFSSAARTATANSADFEMPSVASGIVFHLNISVASGTTPTLDVKLQSKDPISGNYVDVTGAAFAQKTGTGSARLVVHPAITASANVAIAQSVGKTWRVVATIGGTTPSFTFSVAANYVS